MTTESSERPTRLEQELREILERTEAQRSPLDQIGDSMHRRRVETQERFRRSAPQSVHSRFLTPEMLRIVGALVLAVLAVVVGEFSRLLAIVFALASLILFFSLWFPSSRVSSNNRPRWRGRDLD